MSSLFFFWVGWGLFIIGMAEGSSAMALYGLAIVVASMWIMIRGFARDVSKTFRKMK